MKNKKVSKHVSLSEVIKSNTAARLGINNEPTADHLENLKRTCEKLFEPLRENFDMPIGISSGYRSKALNDAINGSSTSQHCTGEALDIDADIFGGIKNMHIFQYLMYNCEFDQLIGEFWNEENEDWSWVHVSFSDHNRGQIFSAEEKQDGGTKYNKL